MSFNVIQPIFFKGDPPESSWPTPHRPFSSSDGSPSPCLYSLLCLCAVSTFTQSDVQASVPDPFLELLSLGHNDLSVMASPFLLAFYCFRLHLCSGFIQPPESHPVLFTSLTVKLDKSRPYFSFKAQFKICLLRRHLLYSTLHNPSLQAFYQCLLTLPDTLLSLFRYCCYIVQ